MERKTTVSVFESTWKRLNTRRYLGISFDKVIVDMLNNENKLDKSKKETTGKDS